MTIQELRDFITNGDFSVETKQKITAVLADKTEATPEVFSQVEIMLQKELDNDFKDAGIVIEHDPEAQAIQNAYTEALEAIGDELGKDMKFVEDEMAKLEPMRVDVMAASDKYDADQIRQSI